MTTPILRADNITKQRAEGFTLDIPRIEFQSNKVYGIVGPNGAGKSTLLKILSLLDLPENADIYFMGERVTASNSLQVRRRMGMVMENPYLFHTSIHNNISAGLAFRSVDKGRRRSLIEDALQLVGLEGFENRSAGELSRGESQRVAIARIVALNPDVLFLDEPFTNIDSVTKSLLEDFIKAVNERGGTTIIYTTHDLVQAYNLADEVLTIIDGRIVSGSLENLFTGDVFVQSGLRHIKISPGISIAAATEKSGRVRASVPPSDIILSIKPFESSAQNSFEGVIRKIHMEGNVVRIFVVVDKGVEFTVLITGASFNKMELHVNSKVFLRFKGTSVSVF